MFQPELFQDLQNQQKPKRFQLSHFPGRFLRFRVAYEDAVFTLLGLVLVLLAGFCVGVERGKRLGPEPAVLQMAGVAAAREIVPAPEAPSVAPSQTAHPAQARKALPVIPAGVSPAPAVSSAATESNKGGFAIQLATYVGQNAAQEEVKRLAKKGIRAQVLKQGRYYELRASGYRSRSEAKQALAALRKSYPDAFMKSVSTD